LAKMQLSVVADVADECRTHDIPLFIEPVSYPVGSEVSSPQAFARIKPELVIETARQMTALPIDVLKAEFPADMKFLKDGGQLFNLCRELDGASQVPWVLLSAGVDIETFCMQVEIACKAGASGFLGGRAIWQEVMPMPEPVKRIEFYRSVVAGRFQRLDDIVSKHGHPWYKKYGLSAAELAQTSERWYREY